MTTSNLTQTHCLTLSDLSLDTELTFHMVIMNHLKGALVRSGRPKHVQDRILALCAISSLEFLIRTLTEDLAHQRLDWFHSELGSEAKRVMQQLLSSPLA
jgi:hypothetical protein